ncbi:winged helix DNA-binding domain-containing protein [Arthrobacter sp. A5]|uniref:winged helix DNA-binding domain-containing protein n=1 Tax=Arthrobacter sp. A5 TaxID=576926 RepID=UPI003DA7F539
MTHRVTPAMLARLRLSSQSLVGSSFAGPVEVVRWMTAMQGQDLPGALWSVGLRAPGTRRSDVQAALDAGEIVRSWPMRGTLHLTAAEDLGWIMALTSTRMLAGMAGRHRQLEITTADIDAVRDVAVTLLAADNASASRDELLTAFRAAGQATENQRGIHLLWLLSLTGMLVQGPSDGNAQRFVLMDRWIRSPRSMDRDEALAELVLRYMRSHGPATLKDFCWWTKLTLKDARTGLQQVQSRLLELQVDGTMYWMSRETADLLTWRDLDPGKQLPGSRSVLLLPGFDEFLLGYTDRSAALSPEYAALTVPGNNGMFKATILARGEVVGTWRRKQNTTANARPGAAVVEPVPFVALTPAQQRGFAKAAEAYAAFLAPASV